jgi:hypothetical protein
MDAGFRDFDYFLRDHFRHHVETNAGRWPDHVQLSDLFWMIVPQNSSLAELSDCSMGPRLRSVHSPNRF